MTTTTIFTRHIGGLVFDATFEEMHTRKLDMMAHPALGGWVIADHATLGAAQVRITAGVSDTPLTHRLSDPFASGKRSQKAFELLCILQEKAEPCDVQTGLKLYQNMVCTSLIAKQDKSRANALYFQAELTQVHPNPLPFLPLLAAGSPLEQASQLVDWGYKQAEHFPFKQAMRFF